MSSLAAASAIVLAYRRSRFRSVLDIWLAVACLSMFADVTLQQKDMILALNLGRTLGSPVPLAAAANEMMNACRGLGIDGNDFVVAHQVYRRLGGQE